MAVVMGPAPLTRSAALSPRRALARLKALSAREVAPGGERGWWRWLVPGLVVAVTLFAALDVRRSSERAADAVSAAGAAEDFVRAAEQASSLHRALPTESRAAVLARPAPGLRSSPETRPTATAPPELSTAGEALRTGLGDLRSEAPAGPVADLTGRTRAAEAALERLADRFGGPGAAGARKQAGIALAQLETLAGTVSQGLVDDGRDAEADARRRLTWTLLGGLGLLGLLIWTFWAKRSAADAARRERRFQALLKNSSDLVMVIDPDDLTVRYVTPVVKRMLGTRAEAVLGTSLLDLAHPDDRERLASTLQGASNEESDGDGAQPWRASHTDGGWIDVEAVCLDLTEDPSVRGTVVTVRDVGERKTLEEQLRHQAFHDPLTSLPNRALFEDRVRHALARARRHGRWLAVLFVDLDDFKTVNDSLGHAAGDDLLRQVAERLDECTRAADTVARLGGDEFAVLVEDPEGVGKAEDVATRMHSALDDKPFEVSGHELFMHSSIGIALADVGASSEDLLRNADMAMYAAKASGKGRTETFRPTMHMAARKRLQLSGDLRRALRDGELNVLYQPLVSLKDERVLGVEALARWTHPELGQVPPAGLHPDRRGDGADRRARPLGPR